MHPMCNSSGCHQITKIERETTELHGHEDRNSMAKYLSNRTVLVVPQIMSALVIDMNMKSLCQM